MATNEWAKAKAREGDEERLLGGYTNPRWLERLRSEVLEEAVAVSKAHEDDAINLYEAKACRRVTVGIRALKHTEDTSDG